MKARDREGERERGREGERERGREGEREGGREGGRDQGRRGGAVQQPDSGNGKLNQHLQQKQTKAGGAVPWNIQTANSDPANLMWEKVLSLSLSLSLCVCVCVCVTYVACVVPGAHEMTHSRTQKTGQDVCDMRGARAVRDPARLLLAPQTRRQAPRQRRGVRVSCTHVYTAVAVVCSKLNSVW